MSHNEKVKELLAFGEPVISKISDSLKEVKLGYGSEARRLIEETEPPKEWVVTEVSKLNQKSYSYIPTFLLEALAKRIFHTYNESLESVSIVQDKAKFAATSVVWISVGFIQEGKTILKGIATEIAPTIEHLQLATPLSRKKAVRNALKELGGLFGKYLNFEANMRDESVADQSQPGQQDTDAEFNRLLTAIKEAPTKAEAQAIIDGAPTFKTALAYNNEVKASINSKPE